MSTCRHEESMWGRCVACGMTWEQQAEARKPSLESIRKTGLRHRDDVRAGRKTPHGTPVFPSLEENR